MANLISFYFEPSTFSLKVNESYQPKIMGEFDDGTKIDITNNSTYLADPTIINSSSLFTISKTGLVTAKYPGTASVQAWGNVYTSLSAYYGVTSGGSRIMDFSGSQTQSGNAPGYPVSSAWGGASNDGGSSGHWAPANARSGGSMGGWMGFSFYTATKVTEIQYEPAREPSYVSYVNHYVEAMVNGSWRTYYPSSMGKGVFETRYRATINETVTAIRIQISGYSSSISPYGPMISVLRPLIVGYKMGYQTQTKAATLTISGFPNEITIDPNGNPAGTEYFVQGSKTDDFASPYTVSNWTTNTTITEELPSEAGIRFYRVKARNSKGVETAWSNVGRIGLLPPENLRLVAAGGKTLTIAWDADAGATEYELLRGDTVVYSGPELTYKDTGLSSATSYTYRVRSKKGTMLSDPSASQTFKTTLAGPDVDLSVSQIGASAAYFKWAGITYQFQKGCNVYLNGVKQNETPIFGGVQDIILKGLKPETTYKISVGGIDNAGTEHPGDETEFKTIAFPTPKLYSPDNTKDYVKLRFEWTNGSMEYPQEYVITKGGVEVFRGGGLTTWGTYQDNSVVFDSVYTYKMRAISGGISSPEVEFKIKVADIAGMSYYSWDDSVGTGSGYASIGYNLAGYAGGGWFYLNKGDIFGWAKDGTPRSAALTDTDMYVMISVQPGSTYPNYITSEDEKLMQGNMYPLWTTASDRFVYSGGDFLPTEIVINKGRVLKYIVPNPTIHSWNQSGTLAYDRTHIVVPVANYGTSSNPWSIAENVAFAAKVYVKFVAKTEAAKARLTAAETPWMMTTMIGY